MSGTYLNSLETLQKSRDIYLRFNKREEIYHVYTDEGAIGILHLEKGPSSLNGSYFKANIGKFSLAPLEIEMRLTEAGIVIYEDRSLIEYEKKPIDWEPGPSEEASKRYFLKSHGMMKISMVEFCDSDNILLMSIKRVKPYKPIKFEYYISPSTPSTKVTVALFHVMLALYMYDVETALDRALIVSGPRGLG